MARDHARIYCSIWRDGDWKSLTSSAQHMYKLLISQENLSYCGVLTYAPAVLSDLASDLTEFKVRRAVKELSADRWVVADDRTHELLVRSYVRHDGVLDRVNMGKATAAALGKVVSAGLHIAVMVELARLWDERPDLAGWIGFKEVMPVEFSALCAMPLAMASGKE